jgi:hypothetical protein
MREDIERRRYIPSRPPPTEANARVYLEVRRAMNKVLKERWNENKVVLQIMSPRTSGGTICEG